LSKRRVDKKEVVLVEFKAPRELVEAFDSKLTRATEKGR